MNPSCTVIYSVVTSRKTKDGLYSLCVLKELKKQFTSTEWNHMLKESKQSEKTFHFGLKQPPVTHKTPLC